MLDREYRKILVKDFKLPIDLFDDDYWHYYTQESTQNLAYGDIQAKEHLLQEVIKGEHFTNAEEFYAYSAKLRETIIKHISSKSEYAEWNNQILPSQKFVEKKQLYQQANNGKLFVSVDLIKANFNTLKHCNPALVDNKETYAEFIQQFTPYVYFVESKQLRQVIFGNLNPSRQQYFQKAIMLQLYADLQDKMREYVKDLSASSSDELVLELKPNINVENCISAFEQWKSSHPLSHMIKTTYFKLIAKQFADNSTKRKEFYIKEDIQTKVLELKSVPGCFYPVIYKLIHKHKIYPIDRMFYYMDCICSFENTIMLIEP